MTNLTKLTKFINKSNTKSFTYVKDKVIYPYIKFEPNLGSNLITIHSNFAVNVYTGSYDPDYDEWLDIYDEWYYFHSIYQLKKWLKKYYL